MYNTYNSLIHELINNQNKHEQLGQSEEQEISQINREIRVTSSSRDNAIQTETKKVKNQIAQSRRELESKKQEYEAVLQDRVEQIGNQIIAEVASTVVKKKTEILNGIIERLNFERLQIATEMKDTLREQGSPTQPNGLSEKEYVDKIGKYPMYNNKYLNIPEYIVYPIIGTLLIFVLFFIGTMPWKPFYIGLLISLINLSILFYLYKYIKYNQSRKKCYADGLNDYNNQLKTRQLYFDNIIAKADDFIVVFESNNLIEYLSPISLEKYQTLTKKYNKNKAKNDSLINLRNSLSKEQEVTKLRHKSEEIVPKFHVNFELAPPTKDIEIAALSEVIEKRKEKKEMGFAELVYWQKRSDALLKELST